MNTNNPLQIEPGDRVLDPLDNEYRTVSHIDNESVFMTDGGVMHISECQKILLPSENPE